MAPTFLLAVAGSLVAGPALGWLFLRLIARVQHVPTAIILQFVSTFGVWILADRIGLSGVLTMVVLRHDAWRARRRKHAGAHPDSILRRLGNRRLRPEHPGVHLHRPADPPDPGRTSSAPRGRYFAVAGAVLADGDRRAHRLAHVLQCASFAGAIGGVGFHPPRPMLRPTVGSGLVISWAGMRGIVTLAAALALPAGFPFRDLIVLTAFSVVLGTLLIQGLTLKPSVARPRSP